MRYEPLEATSAVPLCTLTHVESRLKHVGRTFTHGFPPERTNFSKKGCKFRHISDKFIRNAMILSLNYIPFLIFCVIKVDGLQLV